VGKIEEKIPYAMKNSFRKPCGKNKEKMTYVVHACSDIASLKTFHEKTVRKTHKGKECNIEDLMIFNRL
jgi:hypothetical protein